MDVESGRITIEIIGDSKSAVQDIDRLLTSLDKIDKTTSKQGASLTSFQKKINEIGAALKGIDGAGISKISKLASALQGLQGVADVKLPASLGKQIVNIGNAVRQVSDIDFAKLQEMSQGLQAVSNIGNTAVPSITAPAAPAPAPVASLGDAPVVSDVSNLSSEADQAAESVRAVSSALKDMTNTRGIENETSQAQDLKQKLTETTSGTEKFKKAFSGIGKGAKSIAGSVTGVKALGKGFKGVFKGMSNIVRMAKRRVLYRALNSVITAGTQGLKTGISNLYQWSKSFSGTFSQSMDKLATSSLYLKNSLGALAAPIINSLAPVVDRFVDKIVDGVNYLNEAIARFSGATTWTKALKKATTYAKELKKTILGIDEINAMSGDDSTDTSGMFQEMQLDPNVGGPLDNFFSGLKSGWEKYGVPVVEATKTSFNSVISLGGKLGASFAKAWEEGGTGDNIPHNLSETVSNLIASVGILADRFKEAWTWKSKLFGNGSGEEEPSLGGGIAERFLGVIETITGHFRDLTGWVNDWLSGLDFGPLGISIFQFLKSFGDNLKAFLEPIGPLIKGIIGPILSLATEGILPSIISSLSTLTKVITALIAPVNKIVSVIFTGVGFVLKPLLKIIGWIGDGIAFLLDLFVDSALQSFLDWLGEAFSWTEDLNAAFNEFSEWMDSITFEDFVNGITSAFQAIGEWWNNVTQPIKDQIERMSSWWDEHLVQPIKDGIKIVSDWFNDHFVQPFKNGLEAVKKSFSDTWTKIKDAIKSPLNTMIGWCESFINIFIRGLNTIIGGINKVKIDIPDWLGGGSIGFKIKTVKEIQFKRFADGGVPAVGTAFIAGEAGPEVVANLGSRTGVMNVDQLSAGVAEGVRDANAEQNALLREQNALLRQLLTKQTNVHATVSVSDIVDGISRKNRRDGRTVVPVGV